METIYHYCQGESHKSTEKPCQDFALAEKTDLYSVAIVCDGHGGERYFRSQYGSEFAVKITRDAIGKFIESMSESTLNEGKANVFAGAPFTAYSSATATEESLDGGAHKALRWLFSSIISQWNDAIANHAQENDLDEWEQNHVEEKYKEEFQQKRTQPDATYEKTYGCTLMAYVQTPDYWFAFHLGDGKCVAMKKTEEGLVCWHPIPWDDKCFLNKTTSICDSEALDEFRYCYQGDGEFPLAVFLGSDGMDDSYGDGDNLNNFYIELYKLILNKGKESALKELVRDLPLISAKGSKDDMSVAAVYEDENIVDIFNLLTSYQMKKFDDQEAASNEKITQLTQKIASFGDPETLDRNAQINRSYAEKDLEKVNLLAERIRKRKIVLKGQITKFNNKHK